MTLLPRMVVFGPDGKAVLAGTPAAWCYENRQGFTQKVMELPYDGNPDFIGYRDATGQFISYNVGCKTEAEIVAEVAAIAAIENPEQQLHDVALAINADFYGPHDFVPTTPEKKG